MALFQDFKKATRAEAPNLYDAELAEAEARADALRQRNQNILGGAAIYNNAMGDKSPLTDMMFGGGAAPTAEGAALGMAELGTPSAITATAAADAAAAAQLAGAGGGTAIAGGAGGAGGAGLMGSVGTVAAPLIAALAADELLLDGKGRELSKDLALGAFGKGWLWGR